MIQFEAADNVDLFGIIQEYESYFEMRFGRKPKLIRKRPGGKTTQQLPAAGTIRNNGAASASGKKAQPCTPTANEIEHDAIAPVVTPDGLLSVKGLKTGGGRPNPSCHHQADEASPSLGDYRLVRPLPDFGDDVDLKALAAVITREILQESPCVKWEDIVGLEGAKALLKEAVVMPVKYPQIFTGLLSPWGGILLYGPPGE